VVVVVMVEACSAPGEFNASLQSIGQDLRGYDPAAVGQSTARPVESAVAAVAWPKARQLSPLQLLGLFGGKARSSCCCCWIAHGAAS